jgi:hypothetical protein
MIFPYNFSLKLKMLLKLSGYRMEWVQEYECKIAELIKDVNFPKQLCPPKKLGERWWL